MLASVDLTALRRNALQEQIPSADSAMSPVAIAPVEASVTTKQAAVGVSVDSMVQLATSSQLPYDKLLVCLWFVCGACWCLQNCK